MAAATSHTHTHYAATVARLKEAAMVPGMAHALMLRPAVTHAAENTPSLGTGGDVTYERGGGATGLFGGLSVAQNITPIDGSIQIGAAVVERLRAEGALAAQVGRPMQIGAPVATVTSAPVGSAPADASADAAAAAEAKEYKYKADEFFSPSTVKEAPFRVKIETSLADLASGRQNPTFLFDIGCNAETKLAPDQKVLVVGLDVTGKNCTSAADLGIKIGGLGKTRVSSLTDATGKTPVSGLEYHIELPTLGMAVRERETVISSEMKGLNPQHLQRYGGRMTVEDLRRDFSSDLHDSSIVHVPLLSPVGDAFMLPSAEKPSMTNAQYCNATCTVADTGVGYVTAKWPAVEGMLTKINAHVLSNPEFHWRQTALNKLAFTVVPLTASQQYVASEMGVEDNEKQAVEQSRRFTVTISGIMYYVPVSK
jgi:hypothetical protein